jgi:hypothetical protein
MTKQNMWTSHVETAIHYTVGTERAFTVKGDIIFIYCVTGGVLVKGKDGDVPLQQQEVLRFTKGHGEDKIVVIFEAVSSSVIFVQLFSIYPNQ